MVNPFLLTTLAVVATFAVVAEAELKVTFPLYVAGVDVALTRTKIEVEAILFAVAFLVTEVPNPLPEVKETSNPVGAEMVTVSVEPVNAVAVNVKVPSAETVPYVVGNAESVPAGVIVWANPPFEIIKNDAARNANCKILFILIVL